MPLVPLWSRKFSKTESFKKEIIAELSDAKVREKNIVISGLKPVEGKSDNDLVMSLAFDILKKPLSGHVLSLRRVGKSEGGKPRQLIVTFYNDQPVSELLASTRNLKGMHQYADVYLSPDRSPE